MRSPDVAAGQAPLSWAPGALLFLLWTPAGLLAQPAPVGGELQINAATSQSQSFPAIALGSAGRFVVV